MSKKRIFDIACFGECVIDNFCKTDKNRRKNSLSRIKDCNILFGGRGLNFIAASRLFTKNTLMVSAVGFDYVSSGLKDHLKKNGINDSAILKIKSSTLPKALISLNRRSSIINFYPGLWFEKLEEIKRFLANHIKKVDAKIVFATSGSPALNLQFMKYFPNALKAFGPGHEMSSYKKTELMEILKITDMLFLNKLECTILEKKLGKTVKKILVDFNIDYIITTLSDKGCKIVGRKVILRFPAYPCNIFVDKTGSGDGFAAAFLATYLEKKDLVKSVATGNAFGSFLVEALGGHSNLLNTKLLNERCSH